MTDKKNPTPPPAPFNANDLVQTWWGQPSPSGPARMPDTNTREAIERVRKALESKSKIPTQAAAPAAVETPPAAESPELIESPEASDMPESSPEPSTKDAEAPAEPVTT